MIAGAGDERQSVEAAGGQAASGRRRSGKRKDKAR